MIEGHFDRLRANVIDGWVWDPAQPTRPLCVEVTDDSGNLVGLGLADKFRGDLYAAGKGNGAHGFSIPIPAETLESKRALHIRAFEFNYELIGSPLSLTGVNSVETGIPQYIPPLTLSSEYAFTISSAANKLALMRSEAAKGLAALKEHYKTLAPVATYTAPINTIRAKKDILVFPPIDWNYRYQRPQQLSCAFAERGHRVFYISTEFFDGHGYGVIGTPAPGVFVIRLGCRLPHPEINRDALTSRQCLELSASLSSLVEQMGMNDAASILQNPVWTTPVQALGFGKIVYDCLDLITGFEATNSAMHELELKLIEEADAVICTAASLIEYVRKCNPRRSPVLVRNACGPEFFEIPFISKDFEKRPVVGYIGAIEFWFDCDLILAVAAMNPDYEFVLAGNPSNEARDCFSNIHNIKLLGEIEISKVPLLVKSFDVCIIPFKCLPITKFTNPVKAYEYLAAGRPIVATPMEELDQFAPLVAQAATPEKFSIELRNAVSLSKDPTDYENRRLQVAAHTWQQRADAILNVMNLL